MKRYVLAFAFVTSTILSAANSNLHDQALNALTEKAAEQKNISTQENTNIDEQVPSGGELSPETMALLTAIAQQTHNQQAHAQKERQLRWYHVAGALAANVAATAAAGFIVNGAVNGFSSLASAGVRKLGGVFAHLFSHATPPVEQVYLPSLGGLLNNGFGNPDSYLWN